MGLCAEGTCSRWTHVAVDGALKLTVDQGEVALLTVLARRAGTSNACNVGARVDEVGTTIRGTVFIHEEAFERGRSVADPHAPALE